MKAASPVATSGFILLASLLGLGCGSSTSVRDVLGVPQIVVTSPTDGTRYVQATDVDFGPVLLNAQVTSKVTIVNSGRAPFTVTSIERFSPFSDAFSYEFASFELQPNAQAQFEIRFAPTVAGAATGALDLNVTGGDPAKLRISLSGVGVESACSLSPEDALKFGAVSVGQRARALQVTVHNGSSVPYSINVAAIEQGDLSRAFNFADGFEPGDHVVPAAAGATPGELLIPIEFAPSRVGSSAATLVVAGPGGCGRSVALQGTGVEHVLDCEPRLDVGDLKVCGVDFGYVSPGTRLTKSVTFQNLGVDPITVKLGQFLQPAGYGTPYSLDAAYPDLTLVEGGAPVAVVIAFEPSDIGAQSGALDFSSTDASQTEGRITLQGVGGGPLLEVQPASVDFGMVANGTFSVRRITVANIGTDVPGTALDNLLLSARPQIEDDPAGELAIVTWPPSRYSESGLAEGQNVDILLRFAPTVAGNKSFTVRLLTNDPSKPDGVAIPVEGIGVALPPCNFAVSPPTLNFGVVEPDRNLTLTFRVVNLAASDACLVSMLDLGPGSDGFALVDGPLESATIAGGESLPVHVRFAPKQDGTFAGRVEFYISNPTRPSVSVPLTGVAQNSCLLISPRDLDFGTLPVNCNSRAHVVTIYNVCSSPIAITAIDLQQLGQEFEISQRPALPVTLGGGAQTSFSARYHPTEIGSNDAIISVTLGGTPNPTVIPLTGAGALAAKQTDVFSQGSTPKADVLLIVDDSCSMSPHQSALAANFDSFIQYALQQNVDYHIAVTTVSWDLPQYPCGRFVPLVGSNPRVITPTTPNRQQVFSQNVCVGTGGTSPLDESVIWPAYAALTPPLINGWNAGFYRDDATLAVIAVSDTKDHDPIGNSVAFYEAFFLNLKGVRRRTDFSYNGILPLSATPPPGCSYQGDYEESGVGRAMTLVTATGGFSADICSSNWAKTMEQIGTRAFGKRNKFFLSQEPDLSGTDPITVNIDGLPFPRIGSHGEVRWNYESSSQALVFETLAIPDPGSTVTISYTVACL